MAEEVEERQFVLKISYNLGEEASLVFGVSAYLACFVDAWYGCDKRSPPYIVTQNARKRWDFRCNLEQATPEDREALNELYAGSTFTFTDIAPDGGYITIKTEGRVPLTFTLLKKTVKDLANKGPIIIKVPKCIQL